MGFSDYLTKTRMEKACELLGDIQYKSYDIAYYIGYDNPKNFSRAFKAYFGMTPKEYRNGKVLEKDETKIFYTPFSVSHAFNGAYHPDLFLCYDLL